MSERVSKWGAVRWRYRRNNWYGAFLFSVSWVNHAGLGILTVPVVWVTSAQQVAACTSFLNSDNKLSPRRGNFRVKTKKYGRKRQNWEKLSTWGKNISENQHRNGSLSFQLVNFYISCRIYWVNMYSFIFKLSWYLVALGLLSCLALGPSTSDT